MNSDDRRLNQEAAKARAAGRALGIAISDDDLLRWITRNPAWALGIEDQVGSLAPGKMADVVVWNRNPFSVYAKADLVFIDGARVYDRARGLRPRSDLELGLSDAGQPPSSKHQGGQP